MDNTKPVYSGLHEQTVYLVDTSATSPALFVIKEFPTQLNAGKNLFKLHGHPRNLREDSLLYIEILDYNNEPIYYEIAEVSEEDGSVVIVIYIYETTPPGNCTITIVGEALYVDDALVPVEWQNRSNVMWQRDVPVNSSKTNTSEIIFDTKPTITIQEQISVQLDRTYNTTQTIIYNTGSVQFISNNGTPTLIVNNGGFTPDMIGGTVTIPIPQNPTPISKYITGSIPYTSIIDKVLSTSSILLRSAYLIDPSQSIYGHRYDNFDSSSYSITYESTPTYVPTENSESYALIEINDLQPISGDIARIKVFSNNSGTIGNWDLLSDVVLGDTEIFITDTGSIEPYIPIGMIDANPDTYYQSSAFNGFKYIDEAPNLYYSSNDLTNGLHINTERNISAKNSVDVVRIRDQYAGKFIKGASYKFTLNAIGTRTIATGNTDPIISFYLSGSSFNTDYTDYFNQELPITVGKRIGYLQCKKDKQRFDDNTIIFNADSTGTGVLYYVIESGQWEISDIHVTTNNTPGYTPEYTRIRTKIPTTHKSGVQQSFKVEYYNSQGVKSEHSTISDPIEWVGGNHYIDGDYNLVTGSLFVADKLATGIEFSGKKNSGMIRTTGYTGWNDKNQGIFIWSGSALTSSTTNYNGTGVEMYESEDNYFRFTTDTNTTRSLDFRTNTFFLGNATSSISSNGGNIIFSGSVSVTSASFASAGSGSFTGSFTGSFAGDGSLLTNLPISFALGNILFVSPSGSDADPTRAGHIGNPAKPFLTLNAAKTAASSSDLIYVLPQTFIFDNSAGAYNANPDYVNLWKNGVTYYWSPGCKVKLISYIPAGPSMFLFRPSLTVYETCKSVGYLEYEQYSYLPSNSRNYYFDYQDGTGVGTSTGTDYGCTFFSQTKSQVGYGGTLIGMSRGNSTNTSSIMDLTFISDYEENVWVDGHTGGSFTYSIASSTAADLPISFKSYVKDRVNSNNSFLTIRNMWGTSSRAYFGGETLKQDKYASANRIIEPRITSTLTLDFDIKKIYYSTTHVNTTNACVIADNSNNTSLGTVINLKADLIPSSPNADPVPLFSLGYNTTINYNGNIYTNTTANAGNTIATSNSANSKIYINGNINYIGTGVTTNGIFKTSSGGILKFNGNILGNFASTVAQCGTGTIEINNSRIESSTSGSNSLVFTNGGSSLGTIRINNSTINLSNSSSIGNGAYVKAIINNSMLVNSSTVGNGLENTGANGTLNLINSTIISPSASINYPSGSTVVMANAVVNSPFTISNPVGNINLITDITF